MRIAGPSPRPSLDIYKLENAPECIAMHRPRVVENAEDCGNVDHVLRGQYAIGKQLANVQAMRFKYLGDETVGRPLGAAPVDLGGQVASKGVARHGTIAPFLEPEPARHGEARLDQWLGQ